MAIDVSISSYIYGQVGADNEQNMITNHVLPSYDSSIFTTQIYVINPTQYNHDDQKVLVGHRSQSNVQGIHIPLIPIYYDPLLVSDVNYYNSIIDLTAIDLLEDKIVMGAFDELNSLNIVTSKNMDSTPNSQVLTQAYQPITNDKMMDALVDYLPEITSSYTVTLNASIPILPIPAFSGSAKVSISLGTPAGDFYSDMLLKDYGTAEQGSVKELPILTGITYIDPRETYVQKVIKRGTIMIPPNIVID